MRLTAGRRSTRQQPSHAHAASNKGRTVEAVQELVDLRQRAQVSPARGVQLGPQLVHAARNHGHHVVVARHDAPDERRERLLRRHVFDDGEGAQLAEGLDIPVAHGVHRALAAQPKRQVLQLSYAVRQPNRQLLMQELRAHKHLPLDGKGAKVHHV